MIKLVAKVDRNETWFACTSLWSVLEIARGLRKDGKSTEVVKIDLQELRTHKIRFEPVTAEVLKSAERRVANTNLYAADALHISTYERLKRTLAISGFLCDDRHFQRLSGHARILKIDDLKL